jgi:hypothetical protein
MAKFLRSVSDLRRAIRLCTLLVPTLLVVACDRAVTGTGEIEGATLSAGAPGLARSSRPKYRDSSAPHATGRSGSATLTGISVLGSDGVVRLSLASGGVADPGSGRGEIAKAQVKIIGADGAVLGTINFQRINQGTVTLSIPGVPSNATLQVQANIRGIDGRRTDVVTITDAVRGAPELNVDLHAPEEVIVGVPTPILAVVTEESGSQGVFATCTLMVDGQSADVVNDVWVDAGDAVTCAFTHTFTTSGEYDLEAVVSFDPGTGAEQVTDAASVDASLANGVTYSGSAEDVITEVVKTHEYNWTHPDGSRKEYSELSAEGTRKQTILVNGTLSRPVVWPVAVSLQITTGYAQWLDEDWAGLTGTADASGMVCVNQGMPDGGIFQLCSGGASPTAFAYTRLAGTVTYRSDGWSKQWDNTGALTSHMTWNSAYETGSGGPQAKPWQTSVDLGLEITDGEGTFTAQPSIPLAAFDESTVTSNVCWSTAPYWLEGNSVFVCDRESVRSFGQRGTTTS